MYNHAKFLIKKYAGASYNWKVGDKVVHPTQGVVEITGGAYMGQYGVSNHFCWRKVLEDGTLSEEKFCGYGWM